MEDAISACWKKDLESFVTDQAVEKYWPELRTKYIKEFADCVDELVRAKVKPPAEIAEGDSE